MNLFLHLSLSLCNGAQISSGKIEHKCRGASGRISKAARRLPSVKIWLLDATSYFELASMLVLLVTPLVFVRWHTLRRHKRNVRLTKTGLQN